MQSLERHYLNLVRLGRKKKKQNESLPTVGLQIVEDHCCGLVLVSAFANWRRLRVQHQYLPACRVLRFAIVSSVAVLVSLLITREATHVGIVLASAVVMLIHGLDDVNVVCCAVPLISTCTIVRVFMPPEAESHELFLHLGITFW